MNQRPNQRHQAKGHDLAVAGRRRRVAQLRAAGHTQAAIATAVGCSQPTVFRDLQAVVSGDMAVASEALREMRLAELEGLAAMEQNAVEGFARSGKRGWIGTRLQVQQRRSALLGLDSPKMSAVALAIEHRTDPMCDQGERAVCEMLDRLESAGVGNEMARATLIAMGVDLIDLDLAERIRAERRRVADVAGNGDAEPEPEPAGTEGLL